MEQQLRRVSAAHSGPYLQHKLSGAERFCSSASEQFYWKKLREHKKL